MKIGFIGCGVYGLALTTMMLEKNHNIIMWSKFKEETDSLEPKYPDIRFTNNLKDISNMDLVVIAIPSNFVESTLDEFKDYYTGEDILIAAKGILNDTRFLSELVSETLNTDKYSVISGPTFAIDIVKDRPLGLSLGCNNSNSVNIIKNAIETDYFKLEVLDDVIGIEFCGAIKNVIAISTGMIEGLGYPESTRYKYLTYVVRDIYRVINLVGGKKDTTYSLAGLGDLLLTATSIKSRNYSLGLVIGSNGNVEEYLKNNTTEGYNNLVSIYNLIHKKNIKFDIIDILYDIIYNNKDIDIFIDYIKRQV